MQIAMFQSPPQSAGVEAALARLDTVAGEAARDGADVLVTPEMFLTGYAIGEARARASAIADGCNTLGTVAEIAARHGIGIVVGYPEANGRALPYNTARFFGRNGSVLANYRKSHLWLEVDGAQFSAGEALSPVVPFEGWSVALGICYDIEFPEYARALRLAGAELVIVPTACKAPFDSVSTRVVPTRAEENEMAVAYCNYCGAEGDIVYFGHSVICGPTGDALVMAGRDEALVSAVVSREAIAAARGVLDHVSDRRIDLYGTLVS